VQGVQGCCKWSGICLGQPLFRGNGAVLQGAVAKQDNSAAKHSMSYNTTLILL